MTKSFSAYPARGNRYVKRGYWTSNVQKVLSSSGALRPREILARIEIPTQMKRATAYACVYSVLSRYDTYHRTEDGKWEMIKERES